MKIVIEQQAKLNGHGIRSDLIFGSNLQLRANAEFYGCEDSQQKFVLDFVKAWNMVMNLDCFDNIKWCKSNTGGWRNSHVLDDNTYHQYSKTGLFRTG